MKKKFGLFALVLTVLLCGSLFLFAACGDGEEEEPSATPAISVRRTKRRGRAALRSRATRRIRIPSRRLS